MRIKLGRRSAALIATGAVALTGAGVAQAGDGPDYSGTLAGEQEPGYIGFDVDRSDGGRFVEDVIVSVEVNCRGGEVAPFTYGEMRGRIPVKKNDSFEATRRWESEFGANADSTIKLEGKIVSREVVRGSVRVKEVRADGSQVVARCNSGEKSFRAMRGSID